MVRSRRWRRAVGLCLALATLCIAPATAAADSIAYIKDSNVWIATVDGTGAYQVTLDGTASSPYSSPSQANDGALLAIKGSGTSAKFHHLRQNGDLIDPPFDHSAPAHPHDAQLSPNGLLVVYHWIGLTNSCYPYSCIAGNPKTFFSHSNRFTPGEEITNDVNFQNAAWMSNSMVMLSYGASQTYTYSIGDADATTWFAENEFTVYDPDLDASNSRIVVIADRDSGRPEKLVFFITTGPPPAKPTVAPCLITDPVGGSFDDPTFAPNGGAVAWAEGDGIWRATIGDLSASDCPAAFTAGGPLIAGGSEPDWGPANVNPGARTPPAAGTPAAGTPAAGTPGAGTPGAGTPGAGAPGAGTPAPPRDTTAPSLTRLGTLPQAFRAARGGSSVGAGTKGLRVTYVLSEPATTTFVVERTGPGRRRGGRCVAANRAPRGRRCARTVAVRGSFSHAGAAGENRLVFTGRVGGRSLPRGRYRLVAVARDATGNASAPVRRPFAITR